MKKFIEKRSTIRSFRFIEFRKELVNTSHNKKQPKHKECMVFVLEEPIKKVVDNIGNKKINVKELYIDMHNMCRIGEDDIHIVEENEENTGYGEYKGKTMILDIEYNRVWCVIDIIQILREIKFSNLMQELNRKS